MLVSSRMAYALVPVLSVLVVPQAADALRCYMGWINYEIGLNTVALRKCPKVSQCCVAIWSLNGYQYGCYNTCPSPKIHPCGPDPNSTIQDLHYCYCKDHSDPRCQPYEVKEKLAEQKKLLETELQTKAPDDTTESPVKEDLANNNVVKNEDEKAHREESTETTTEQAVTIAQEAPAYLLGPPTSY